MREAAINSIARVIFFVACHLFEHLDCLPCHYANVFTLGSSRCAASGESADDKDEILIGRDIDGNPTGDNLVGGTAFVSGSHSLSVAARITASEDDDNDMNGMRRDESGIIQAISRGKSVSAASSKAAREEMYSRIVRPSLEVGDVLIFDCRILHFGLANRSGSAFHPHQLQSGNGSDAGVRRPMLYVNMTHSWFHDPKNWDDREAIFPSR